MTRLRVPAVALLLTAALSATLPAPGRAAGLWTGTVILDRVFEATAGVPATGYADLAGTPATLPLRLLLHVDETGTVRLLKEVFQVWEDGSGTKGDPGFVAGHYVLLTDHTKIPDYKGATLKDGEEVGRRISTVGFDFPDNDGQYVACTGALGAGLVATCAFTLGAEQPTNPFYHRYHPDHDEWDDRRENKVAESRTVAREIVLAFSAASAYGSGEAPPGYGVSLIEGVYFEKLTGLYKAPIFIGGPFTLSRVTDRGLLNE